MKKQLIIRAFLLVGIVSCISISRGMVTEALRTAGAVVDSAAGAAEDVVVAPGSYYREPYYREYEYEPYIENTGRYDMVVENGQPILTNETVEVDVPRRVRTGRSDWRGNDQPMLTNETEEVDGPRSVRTGMSDWQGRRVVPADRDRNRRIVNRDGRTVLRR
jgi:hypothetical protein